MREYGGRGARYEAMEKKSPTSSSDFYGQFCCDDSPDPWRAVAWCPEQEPESSALPYEGESAREVAGKHAEHRYFSVGEFDGVEVRVRATRGGEVREWDVFVDTEIEVHFDVSIATRREASSPPAGGGTACPGSPPDGSEILPAANSGTVEVGE